MSVGRMASVNENNNRSQLGNKLSTSMEVSETEVNPFKLYHTENVIAEIKAVLATRPLNKYKSTSTFLPSSLNRYVWLFLASLCFVSHYIIYDEDVASLTLNVFIGKILHNS